MRTRRLVDPELLPLLDSIPPMVVNAETLPGMRSRVFPFEEDPAHVEKVSIETRTIPGPKGAPDVGIVILRPRAAKGPLPAALHMHGGGFVAGTAEAFAPHQRNDTFVIFRCRLANFDRHEQLLFRKKSRP